MVKIDELELLEKAIHEENLYNWKDAAKLYEIIAQSYINKGEKKKAVEMYYKSGWSFFEASYSSDNAEEFEENGKNLIRTLKESENLNRENKNVSEELECKGFILLIEAVYFTKSKEEFPNLVRKSLEILIKSYNLYDNDRVDEKFLRRVYLCGLGALVLAYCSNDPKEIFVVLQKGLDFAYEAWKFSNEVKNFKVLTDSLELEATFWKFITYIKNFKEDKHWKEYLRNLLLRCDESLKIIEESKNTHFLSKINWVTGLAYVNFGFHFLEEEIEQRKYLDKGTELIEKAISSARETGNNYILIQMLFDLDFYLFVMGRIEYLQRRIIHDIDEITKKGKIFENSNFAASFLAYYMPAFYYSNSAQMSFFPSTQRISYAKKGIEYAKKALIRSLCEFLDITAYQALNWSYSQLIVLTPLKEERIKNTRQIIKFANKAKEIGEKFEGGFTRAFGYSSMYRAYKTLADISNKKPEKIKRLNIAIEASKDYINHALESRTGNITAKLRLGLLYEEIGILTLNNNTLLIAKEIFNNLSNECIKRKYHSYAAAAYEYIARIEDRLGNHHVSASYYEKAKNIYLDSVNKVSYKLLKKRINEKMHYADAWSFIENAKAYHKKENHQKAKENYKKASEILKDLLNFNYESIYYSAWSIQEEAEQLSKLEMHKDAIEKYELTNSVFKDSVKVMEEKFNKINDKFTKQRIEKLKMVAQLRMKYCSARSNIEKARILGKQGEYCAAAELFASAALEFRDVCNRFKIESERVELEAVYFLCRAWENMELAEKYADPKRFAEAANLFIKASKLFRDSKLKLLASGNSAFCQALELGCEFDGTHEYNIKAELYPKIRAILRKAASSYGRGGFEKGSDWALATLTYFDAAWSLMQADEKLEFEEREKLLGIGAEYLKSAATLFNKAGYKDKEKEALKHLNIVTKEEKIILSALNSIKKPSISGSTMGIIAPACSIETSQSPRLGEVVQFTQEERRALGEGLAKKKYEIIYRDLFKEVPRVQKREFRVGIAQIGLSKSGDIIGEFYKMASSGLLELKSEKVEELRNKIKNIIEDSQKVGISVLVFPEMTIDLNYGKLMEEISDLAKLYGMYIIPGSFHNKETKKNIAIVFGPDGILWEQEKYIPATIRYKGTEFKEGLKVLDFSRKIIVCNTEFGRITVIICRDFLDMDLRVELKHFEPPVDLIINPAFTPVTADFKAIHFDARRSIYAYCFFANVAEFGDSLIYTPEKERIERIIPAKQEGLIFKDIDLFKLRSERKKWEKEKEKEIKFIQSTR
jgi:predicted amidohydrolase